MCTVQGHIPYFLVVYTTQSRQTGNEVKEQYFLKE